MRRFLSFITLFSSAIAFAQPAKIAIVIDDIGYRITDKQVLTLPKAVTFSVLPHTPFGLELATSGFEQSREILIHVPMEATNGKKLGPGALTQGMTEQQIHQTLDKSFAEIPFAIGINNHMGSLLTRQYQPMAWTMSYLKDKGLLFLDSVTVTDSVGFSAAKKLGVPVMKRNIFLDNHQNHAYIAGQFQQLVDKAIINKVAIGIAHPHPQSILSLNKLIPTLKEQGIELVPLSSLYPIKPPVNDIQHEKIAQTTAK